MPILTDSEHFARALLGSTHDYAIDIFERLRRAHDREFGIKMAMARQAIRRLELCHLPARYVITNPRACCLVILEPVLVASGGGCRCPARHLLRVVRKNVRRREAGTSRGQPVAAGRRAAQHDHNRRAQYRL